jgi:SRSO17 transposase
MLISAFAAGVPCRWVTGDSVYGADYALRRCIEKGGRGYVLAVTSRLRLGFKTVADWLEDVPSNADLLPLTVPELRRLLWHLI